MHNPLEQLDHIKASKETKEKTISYVLQHKKRKKHTGWILSSALVFTCLCFFIIQSNFISKPNLPVIENKEYCYVSIDINPSLEFTLDKNKQVVDVQSFNEDGQTIINTTALKEKSLTDAFHTLFTSPSFNTYIENGIIEVGVYSKDSNTANRIQKEITLYLQENATKGSYHCTTIDNQTVHSAKEHHISPGKYRVIENILLYDANTTRKQLNTLSMKELYSILAKYEPESVPENCYNGNQKKHKRKGHH